MPMKSDRHYRFGAKCIRCNAELVAPEWSAYAHEAEIRHQWRCCDCGCFFETTVGVGSVSKVI